MNINLTHFVFQSVYKPLLLISVLFAFILLNINHLTAQETTTFNFDREYYIVEAITISGNKKTKRKTITRELNFGIGDTLWTNDLQETLTTNRNQIYNLGLFNEVLLNAEDTNGENINLKIEVAERWYWLVFPIFELADRNFNVWWRDFNHDFRRTKYGFIAKKNNVAGRNETFILNFKWGYNRKVIFSYVFPFIDKKKVWGLSLNTYYFADKEMAYTSVNNEALFYTHNSFANSRIGAGVNITHRSDIKNTHGMQAYYYRNTIVDTLGFINPSFLNNGTTKQQFFNLRYQYEHDGRNIRAYPTEGWYFRGRLEKNGVGAFKDINRYRIEADVSKYTKIGKSQFVGTNVKWHSSFGEQPPYSNNLRLGFLEHFVRGYEYYVIDAQHYVTVRNAMKQRLFDIKYKGLSKINDQFKVIPIQIYLKFFNEIGWSHDAYYATDNPLNNTVLASYGVGLDLVTFYDNVFSFEYTMNQRREHGFIVHINVTWDFY